MSGTSTRESLASSTASTESRRALVRRVVGSTAFAKSERLSSFLICICDLTLSGRANEINEQKIGTAVFGRAPDYDSSIDGIVRPQASRLRQRLDLFFSGEGANEPVRITLPRGSYVPVFESNSGNTISLSPSKVVEPTVEVPTVAEVFTEQPTATLGRNLRWLVPVVIVCVAVAIGGWVTKDIFHPPMLTVKHPLWSVLFRPDQRTIVVPGDTGFVMWQSATHQNIGLAGYLGGSYRAESAGDIPKGQIDPADLASRRYTSIVDLGIVRQLTQIADTQKTGLTLSYARDFQVAELKEANVVLIGATASNPWVELFEPKMNFVFADARLRRYTVLNRAPKADEPQSWTADYDDPQHRVYGVVGFLGNLGGNGNVLIVEGTSMAGTQCAWDFVADDSTFLPFVEKIRRPDGSVPHFQLVLDSTNLTGSAVKKSVLAWRVFD